MSPLTTALICFPTLLGASLALAQANDDNSIDSLDETNLLQISIKSQGQEKRDVNSAEHSAPMPSGGRMQKNDAWTGVHAVQFVVHDSSECAGPILSNISYQFSPDFLDVTEYFENVSYSLCGHQLVGGGHSFPCLFYCAQSSLCGGYTMHPEGFCTLWHTAEGFSVHPLASEALNGYRCYEKLTTDTVQPEDVPDDLILASDVAMEVSNMNYDSICNATCLTEASKEECVQRTDQGDNQFGRYFESPVNFYVMPDKSVKVNATYAEACVQDYREYVKQSEDACNSQ